MSPLAESAPGPLVSGLPMPLASMTTSLLPRVSLAFCSLLALAGCGDRSPPPAPAAGSVVVSAGRPPASAPAPIASASAPAKPASDGPRFSTVTGLSGGKSLHFRLFLERNGDDVTGYLLCDSAEQATRIHGKMLDERRFRLEERGKKGKAKAVLEGELDGQTLRQASWSDGKKKGTPLRPDKLVPFDARDTSADVGYAGGIGDKLRIRAQLKRDGKQVTGFYRYARSREDLKLTGSVDPVTGKFDLQESNARGTATGRLQGTFLKSGFLVGTWASADGSRTLPLVLESSKPLAQITELPGGVKVIPREEEKQVKASCSASSGYPEFEGMKDRKLQDALNKTLRKEGTASIEPDVCQEAEPGMPYTEETSYTLTSTKKKGFVGVSFGSYAYTGGAHGMSGSVCRVIDLDRGEMIELHTLLAPDALPKLSKLANEALRREHKTEALTEAGFFDDEIKVSDKPNLCLFDDHLELSFSLYEIAPYAMGTPTVELKFSDAAPLFKKNALTDAVLK